VVDVGDDAKVARMVQVSHRLVKLAKITHLEKYSTFF
jgi:hypothetical protein